MIISHQPESWDLPQELRGHALMPSRAQGAGLWDDFNRQFDKLYFDSAGYGGAVEVMRGRSGRDQPNPPHVRHRLPFEFRDPKDTRHYISSIKSLNISDEDKRNILGQNVLNLFKIS